MKEVNKENEFERRLKEKADRFEMKPAPEVWQQVQHAVQKDRRRRFGWWLMAALLFAVMGTGAFFMFQEKAYKQTTPATVENNADRKSNGANNSSSEANNKEKNPSSGSINDNESAVQNQSADITESKNRQEKILKNKSQNESHSNPIDRDSESAEALEMLKQVQHDDNDASEFIASLSLKQLPLSLSEASIHERPFEKPTFDWSSAPSSKHSFYFEADAMALKSFVWSQIPSSLDTYASVNSISQVNTSSYASTQGFSAGGNFIFEQNNKWLLGIGMHLTKTHHEAVTGQQAIPLYDTTYAYNGVFFDTTITNTRDTMAYQSRSDLNQWLDVSFITGVKLFPSSKNHLRILAGAAYSRLIADANSQSITPKAYDAFFDSIPMGVAALNGTTPDFAYRKNQLQLFSEVAYQRDLTAQLSFTAGMQFHYYPMNLLDSEELSQHMMWVGLKGGLLLRF